MALVALAGCGSTGGGSGESGSSCLTTYGYETDQYGNSGLHLFPTITAVGNFYTFISFEQMEAEYIDLEMCVANNNTPGPNVNFTSFNHIGFNAGLAVYSYASQTIYMNTDVDNRDPMRNCISDRKFLRHEYTHHVLFMNGQDSTHNNTSFVQCDALGPKTCNGQYCE